jgi:hypothetical protein
MGRAAGCAAPTTLSNRLNVVSDTNRGGFWRWAPPCFVSGDCAVSDTIAGGCFRQAQQPCFGRWSLSVAVGLSNRLAGAMFGGGRGASTTLSNRLNVVSDTNRGGFWRWAPPCFVGGDCAMSDTIACGVSTGSATGCQGINGAASEKGSRPFFCALLCHSVYAAKSLAPTGAI